MYTAYSIEKIAASSHREALAAATERRTARAFQRTATSEHRHESPASSTIRIPRQIRWFGVTVTGR